MPSARTCTAALTGIEAHLVQIVTDVSEGLPATVMCGLTETALREARDRIRAAVINTGHAWPDQRITITVRPPGLPNCGSSYDLAIAVSVLAASGVIFPSAAEGIVFYAELGLDGALRSVPGAAGAGAAGARCGLRTLAVAPGNADEARLIPEMTVLTGGTLADVIACLRDRPQPATVPADAADPIMAAAAPAGQVRAAAWTPTDIGARKRPGDDRTSDALAQFPGAAL